MIVDQVKNLAATEQLVKEQNLITSAFQRGMKDFFQGKREVAVLSPSQYIDAINRIRAINSGTAKVAKRLTKKLVEQHLSLADEQENGVVTGTVAYYTRQAVCPYAENTDMAREWHRGYNLGFKKNRNRERKYEKRR